MSRAATGKGKTIAIAQENALRQLGVTADDVEFEVIRKPSNGFIGLFGKDAVVKATVKEQELPEAVVSETIVEEESPKEKERAKVQKAQQETGPEEIEAVETEEIVIDDSQSKADKAVAFLEELFDTMDIGCDVEVTENAEFLKINLKGDKMGILIGRRGQTLDAIQYLTSLAVNKEGEDYTRIILDTENYREKRQRTLEALADKMANKALRYGRRVTLEPMNPAERRIIHARLQDNRRVVTYSEGQDPYRHVVIQAN